MKLSYKLTLLIALLLLCKSSCKPDEEPDPEETFWQHIYPIERELFDFPKGSYWIMQNTLDTTQIDTFERIWYSKDTSARYIGNDVYIDVVLQYNDQIINHQPLTGIDYRLGLRPYLYMSSSDGIYQIRTDFYYTSGGEFIPDASNRGWTEISYPTNNLVRFLDKSTNNFLEIEKGVGLHRLWIEDTLWTRIDYHHTN